MDTSQVVNPVEFLRNEAKVIGNSIAEIDGNIATLHVQRARMVALHDAMVAGTNALYGEPAVPGQLDLKLDADL
jgi:hypothetical protein